MSDRLITYEGHLATDEMRAPSDSAHGSIALGLAILLAFFCGLGAWAATAPLNAAIVGEAVVKVAGNRKSIQHFDGGIVRELLVREGDRVAEGDVLIVLDDTEAHAQVEILGQQEMILRAAEARLRAELNDEATITYPLEIASRLNETAVGTVVEAQEREFHSLRIELLGEQQILQERISQLSEQIAGNEAQAAAFREQLQSVNEERESLEDLFSEGLVTKSRLLELERTATGLRAQIAVVDASTAVARQSSIEYALQIEQVSKARRARVTDELAETRAKLLDIAPRLGNARAVLERTEIKAPYTGEVVDLSVHSVGAVVGRGERILDIVPEQTALVVEAKIAVEDIADLRPGMQAEVRFNSYKQRTMPLIHGTVTQISADRLTDERNGYVYYIAEVSVDEAKLAATTEVQLYPGMPAIIMITTRERTALDYLLSPLTASLDRAFKQQ